MTERPNVLLLFTDQQRFDTIAAAGAAHMRTPNLDRLVQMGTTFSRAYSANPVCMPARHDLITGTSARRHGYYHNQDACIKNYGLPMLPRLLLDDGGYQTCAVGKMHFYPRREHHGYAHMFLMSELPIAREDDAYLQYLDEQGYGHVRCQHGVRPLFYHTPQEAMVPEEHHGSAWVATKTNELIGTARQRPFFIMTGWVAPHPPYYVPEKTRDMYRDHPLPLPCPSTADSARHAPVSVENPDPEDVRARRMREAYFAAVSLVDKNMGRILDALEERGELDKTLIIFTSDHGEMLGDRGCYQKHVPYEGSAHIPLIVAGPGFEAGAVCEVPTVTWDLYPTILEAAGVAVPDGHPALGISLFDRASRDPDRIIVFHHAVGRSRFLGAVGQGHKFIHWINGGDEELYDLVSDPWEQENLLGAPDDAASKLADRLRAACVAFEHKHGIAHNVEDDAFVDLAYEPPDRYYESLYPRWPSRQFPRWMNGYSQADLDAIAEQMWRCVESETAYICQDPEWRAEAVQAWEAIGGDRSVYEAIFAAVDARVREKEH